MMEGWNDGIMELERSGTRRSQNKRLDSYLFLPFFQYSIFPLIQIKKID